VTPAEFTIGRFSNFAADIVLTTECRWISMGSQLGSSAASECAAGARKGWRAWPHHLPSLRVLDGKGAQLAEVVLPEGDSPIRCDAAGDASSIGWPIADLNEV
jgi:hypothetical protein